MKTIIQKTIARAASLLLGVMATASVSAETATYIDADGNEQTVDAEVVTSLMTTFTDGGWYVVNDDITVSSITNSGTANLILADGATLTAAGAYHFAGIANSGTLSIYGQSAGSGALVATGGSKGAGIGGGSNGDNGEACGTVKIYGGNITATGGKGAAGIGGGAGGSTHGEGGAGGTVEIYGGTVTATGGSENGNNTNTYGPGIGGGTANSRRADNGTLTVAKGMTVVAGTDAGSATARTPDAETGAVTISTTATADRYFKITSPTALSQTTSDLGEVEQGAVQSWDLAETLEGNVTPYIFSGDVPAGFTFADGVLTLGDAAGGIYNITLTAAGSAAPRLSKPVEFTWTVTVLNAPKTITYMDGENVLDLASYRPGIGATLPVPEKPGYTFLGWFDNAGLTGAAVTAVGTDATEDLTFYSKWTVHVYSITYKEGNTTLTGIEPATYTIEAAATLPESYTEKAGQGFYGWFDNAATTGTEVTVIPAGSIGDKVFYAKWGQPWTRADYIDAAGASANERCVVVTSSTTAFEDDGWYVVTGNVAVTSGISVSGSANLILADDAMLTVTNTTNRGAGIHVTGNTTTLSIYGQTAGNGTLQVSGNNNSGAGIGGQGANSSTTIEACGNVTIYGGRIIATGGTNAAGIGGGGNTGTRSRGGNGGTVKVYGGTVTATGGAANAAGIGGGYGRSGSGSTGTLTVATGMVVKVGARANPTASPTINANGEVTLSSSNSRYFTITEPGALVQSESALENGVERIPDEWDLAASISGGVPGYTFAGELPEGFELTAAGVLSTLATAKAGDYSITVTVTDSGAGRLRKSVEFTWTVTILNAPKTITYMDGEKTLTDLEPETYNPGVAASLPATATKDGYDFVAWYDNPELAGDPVTAVGTDATEDLTFYSKWTVHVYSITYKEGNTTLTGIEPATYTIEAAATLPESYTEKAGQGFYGWFDNAATTGTEVTVIPAGTTGDKTFYAKWGDPWVAATYIGADGKEATAKSVVVTSSTTAFEDGGWYVVNGEVETDSITVTGSANLILADRATLTAQATKNYDPGIRVSTGNTLNIYAQSAGTGALSAQGYHSKAAGIGGGSDGTTGESCGTVKIYGGKITATGLKGAAAIGGGAGSSSSGTGGAGGTVEIYGGTVTAIASSETNGTNPNIYGPAIGGGTANHARVNDGTFANYGGTVVARGVNNANAVDIGATFTVTGGSTYLANGTTTADATDGNGNTVYCVTVPELVASTNYVFKNLGDYGQANIVSDADGKVYLWLPNGDYSFTVAGTYDNYTATVASAATTATKSGAITDNSDDHKPVGYMDGTTATAVILETTNASITIPETADKIDLVISGNEATLTKSGDPITIEMLTIHASSADGVKQDTDVTGAFKVTEEGGAYVVTLDKDATVAVKVGESETKDVKVEPQIDTAFFPPIGVVNEKVDFAVATIPGLWYGILTCDTPNGKFAVAEESEGSVIQAEGTTSHVKLPIGTESVMFYKVRVAPSKAGVFAK